MITVKNLTKKFGDFTALDNISCTIPEGSIYGMVGSNGAGKSTFLRLITGVYKADGGEIKIDGMDVYENVDAKRLFMYVPDELYFINGASIERMAKLYSSMYKGFDFDKLRSYAEKLGLNTRKSLNTFSKGMRRQASIILALATNPKYIFFDETFDGLDPVVRNVIKGFIYNDVVERKATAIITSHSLRELEDTCDQLAMLHKGGMVFEREIADLKTSLFKVQIALNQEYSKEDFEDIDIIHFTKKGSVSNMIVRGDREQTIEKLKTHMPIILDILPLSLEEVFTYEMSALGYDFSELEEG